MLSLPSPFRTSRPPCPIRWMVILSLLGLLPAVATAFSAAPPDQKTGAPGEGTCHDCHGSFPLNSGEGSLTIMAPPFFAPEQTYVITVTLEDPNAARWGFELTPLDIGTILVTDPVHTQLSLSGGNSYIKQTSAGTYAGTTGSVTWIFEWTSPVDPPDAVTFYAAGNAANNNGATSGDYIYTAASTTTLAPADGNVWPVAHLRLALHCAPNPVAGHAHFELALPRGGMAQLEIFDALGRLVRQWPALHRDEGLHRIGWDGRGDDGASLTTGVYLARLTSAGRTAQQRILKIE